MIKMQVFGTQINDLQEYQIIIKDKEGVLAVGDFSYRRIFYFIENGYSQIKISKTEDTLNLLRDLKSMEYKLSGKITSHLNNDWGHVPLESLELPCRAYNVLKQLRVHTLHQMRLLTEYDILSTRNCGKHTCNLIMAKIEEYKLKNDLKK